MFLGKRIILRSLFEFKKIFMIKSTFRTFINIFSFSYLLFYLDFFIYCLIIFLRF